eukprot:gene11795-11590_t
MAIPQLIFALLILSVVGTTATSLVLVIALLDATRVFRLSRAVAMNVVVQDFVEAARLRGEGLCWLVTREVLPNAAAPLIAEFGLRFCFVFLFISALSFLGLGIQPPTADWGSMVRDNAVLITFGDISPLLPALAVALITVSVNFVRPQGMLNMTTSKPLLEIRNLHIEGHYEDAWHPLIKGIDLTLQRGEVLGLIGESGAGKSTLGLSAMGYTRDGCKITGGTVHFDGIDLLKAKPEALRKLRGLRIAYVAQSAAASFNPAHRLIDQHVETAVKNGGISREQAMREAVDLYREKPLLELRNSCASYGRQPVLHDVSLKLYRGQTLAVIGESGSGKSSTARLITGLLPPTHGQMDPDWLDRLLAILIVHAHPEPQSFTAALRDQAVATLEAQGHEVQVSDLYKMNWNPVASADDFSSRENPEYLVYALEQRLGVKSQSLAADIQAELDKLLWADLLILNFPIFWFSTPAMLKGWIDRVLVSGICYGGKRFYDQGGLAGKKALVTVTLGGREHMFGEEAIHGPLQDMLRPILRGTLAYVGFDVLEPFVAWHVPYVSDEARQAFLLDYDQRLQHLSDDQPLVFPKLSQFDEQLYPLHRSETVNA